MSHVGRRIAPVFACCDPLHEHCTGRSHSTMYDHARARAGWTGYRQKLIWSRAHRLWLVYGTTKRCKPVAGTFDIAVNQAGVNAE